MPHGNEARIAYRCRCGQCKRDMVDQKDNPVYVVALDVYFCDAKCWDKYRKAKS